MDRFLPSVSRRRALLIGAALTLAGGSLEAEESLAGTIEALRGDAFAEGPKPRRTLQPKAQVFIGDMVETAVNSALTMHLGKATFVKLGALATERNPLPARNAPRSHRAQTTSAFRTGSFDFDPTGDASCPECEPATVNTSISALVPRS